jgi:6-phosphogluconolactonase
VVYAACADNRRIELFGLDADGGLDHRDSFPVPGVEGPSEISMPMAFGGDRRFLYVAVRQAPYPLCTFGVSPEDGALSLLGTTTTPDSLPYLALDPASTHVLCASAEKGLVMAVRLEDGVAGPITSTVELGARGHCVRHHPSLPVLYAAGHVGDLVHWIDFDAEAGRFRRAGQTTARPGSHPRHIEISTDGAWVYVLNEADASVSIFGVDPASGALSHEDTVPTRLQGRGLLAADIHLSRDGRFIYTSERRANVLLIYEVAEEGRRLIPGPAAPAEDWTRSFAIDPDGLFLIGAGQRSDHLGVYAIAPGGGELSSLHRYPTGPNPSWVEAIRLPEPEGVE